MGWAEAEIGTWALGDPRRARRLVRLMEDLAANPGESIPEASGDWAATKGAYRFYNSEGVRATDIRAEHAVRTIERLASQKRILVIQDTTELDYSSQPAKTGMGYLDWPSHTGLKVHSALAVTVDGVPQGVIHQEVWARDPQERGKKATRHRRPIDQKESQRWLRTCQAIEAQVPEEVTVITVADREADIYELFTQPRRANHELLIRAHHNRRILHEAGRLREAVAQSPSLGAVTTEIPRSRNRPASTVTLTLRAISVALQPPGKAAGPLLTLQVITATEEAPPPGVKAIDWLLLTTLAVTTAEDVIQIVSWYQLRWLVERLHYVLKSGCGIERLQMESRDRIERALAVYCLVAWRHLWLTYEARQNGQAPCTVVLATHQWQALYCTIHRTPTPPPAPPSLQQAVRWIAQLGGFLGRTGDGQPGVKVIWRGLRRLEDIAATWALIHGLPLDSGLVGNG